MKERFNQKPEDRENCVQLWLHISHDIVPINYLSELETSYKNAGRKTVNRISERQNREYLYLFVDVVMVFYNTVKDYIVKNDIISKTDIY